MHNNFQFKSVYFSPGNKPAFRQMLQSLQMSGGGPADLTELRKQTDAKRKLAAEEYARKEFAANVAQAEREEREQKKTDR